MLKLDTKIHQAEVVHTGPEIPLVSNDGIFRGVPGLALESVASA